MLYNCINLHFLHKYVLVLSLSLHSSHKTWAYFDSLFFLAHLVLYFLSEISFLWRLFFSFSYNFLHLSHLLAIARFAQLSVCSFAGILALIDDTIMKKAALSHCVCMLLVCRCVCYGPTMPGHGLVGRIWSSELSHKKYGYNIFGNQRPIWDNLEHYWTAVYLAVCNLH